MSKKVAAPLRIAPLQYVIAEPITDPAELERIDRQRKAVRKAMAAAERKAGKRKSPKRK
jgi:hypothetical protein